MQQSLNYHHNTIKIHEGGMNILKHPMNTFFNGDLYIPENAIV